MDDQVLHHIGTDLLGSMQVVRAALPRLADITTGRAEGACLSPPLGR